jgi:O-antigen ligase
MVDAGAAEEVPPLRALAEGSRGPRSAGRPAPAHEASARGRHPLALWLYWGHLVGLFGLAVSNTLLGLAVLAAPFAGSRVLLRREVRALLLVLAAYAGLLGISIATSFDPGESLRHGSELYATATLLVGLVVARGERRLRLLVDAVLLLATFESLVGIGQLVAQGGADLSRRIQGTLSHYMTFAGLLMIADLLLLARVVVRGRSAGWRAALLVPINVALLATLTRSAWVGLLAGALVLLAGRPRALLWSLPAGLLLLLLLPATVLDRAVSIVDPSDPTNHDRLCMASAGAQMIAERPWTGQGPGMVESRYPLYRLPDATRRAVPHLHNAYLQVAAERGLPALLALLLLLALPAARALRLLRVEGGIDGHRADLHLGVFAALVGFAVAGLFEDNWGDTEVQRLVLMLLALPFGLAVGDEGDPPPGIDAAS